MRFALAALLLHGCLGGRAARQKDPLAAALVEADAAWLARAEDGARLAASVNTLMAKAPNDPRVLWRLARLRWWEGAASTAPLAFYEDGRAAGYRCLLANPGFAELSARAGDRVDDAGLAALASPDVPCIVWTTANAISHVAARGPGAALRIEEIGKLAERGRELGDDPTAPGVLLWVQAEVALSDASANREEARGLLTEAIGADPRNRLFRETLARAFPDAAEDAWEGWTEPRGRW